MPCAKPGKQGSGTRCGLAATRTSSLFMTTRSLTACTRRSPRHRPPPVPTSATVFGNPYPESRDDGYKRYWTGLCRDLSVAKCSGRKNALTQLLSHVRGEGLQRPHSIGKSLRASPGAAPPGQKTPTSLSAARHARGGQMNVAKLTCTTRKGSMAAPVNG